MVYVPKTLVVGRCVRCGKRIYKGDVAYRCPRCDVIYCPQCREKTHGKCPICLTELVEA